jgi:hypothetical protein
MKRMDQFPMPAVWAEKHRERRFPTRIRPDTSSGAD